MKHKAFTLVEAIVVVVILAIAALVLFPILARPRENIHRQTCPSNLKQLALGVKQYIQDYDEKYPLTTDWGETAQPYLKSWQIFQCPSDKTGNASKTTDYFFNARLSGIEEGKLDWISITILMGDGAGDSPPSYHLSQLPDAWRKDENSPAWRHLDGANYAFADGHVKWLRAEKITLDKPNVLRPTFLLGGSKP